MFPFWAWEEHKAAQARRNEKVKAEIQAIVAKERANVIAAVVEEYELMLEEARERAQAEDIDIDRFLRRRNTRFVS